MRANNEKLLNRLVRAGAQYAAEKKAEQMREDGAPHRDTGSPLAVGVVMTVMGGLLLLLTGQIIALPMLIAGLTSLGFAAGLKRRKKAQQKDAEQAEIVPKTEQAAKKIAEQKQFLDSGLITKEEYDENCAKIRAKETIL